MKSASLFLVHCLFATGFAKPAVFLGYQDSLGQYSFGYSAPGSARSEVRTSNGATRGTYSYIDETGVIQTAQYTADSENGFQVIATNLPQAPLPVQDTPEVMAARTAHLQALELATRRDEEAQNQEIQESAQERKIEGNQGEVSLLSNLNRVQEQPAAKSAENRLKVVEQKISENAGSVQSKKDNEESLQAIASRSGAVKQSEENSQAIREEIIGGADVPVVPLISSRLLLPETPGLRAVPVYRITHGTHEIEPPAIPESSIAQAASGVITPASTALRGAAISTKEAATAPARKQQTQHANEQAHAVNTLRIIPLSVSSLVGYVPSASLHYVAYNVL